MYFVSFILIRGVYCNFLFDYYNVTNLKMRIYEKHYQYHYGYVIVFSTLRDKEYLLCSDFATKITGYEICKILVWLTMKILDFFMKEIGLLWKCLVFLWQITNLIRLLNLYISNVSENVLDVIFFTKFM